MPASLSRSRRGQPRGARDARSPADAGQHLPGDGACAKLREAGREAGRHAAGQARADPKLRELCLLHAVKLEGGEYEWVQHVPIARDLGCTEAQIAALDKGDDRAACFDAREKAALRFTREVVVDVRASEAALAEARKHLSNREIVELILMSGFYIMLARLTESLGVETEAPMGSALIRDIEKRVAARKAKPA